MVVFKAFVCHRMIIILQLRKTSAIFMIIKIDNIDINYIVEGTGAPIILLHGWGGCIDSWYPITEHLKKDFRVYVLDLPGFGKSDRPKEAIGIKDYALLISLFINKLKINNPVVVGHSFGGSVAAVLSAFYPQQVLRLVLTEASGIRIKSIKLAFIQLLAEGGKNLFNLPLLKHFHSVGRNILYNTLLKESDYYSAGDLKEILKKIISEDIRDLIKKINIPTLLIWGKNDKATPLWQGELLHSLIPNSKLVVIPNCGHFAYLENPESFLEEVEKFIKQE